MIIEFSFWSNLSLTVPESISVLKKSIELMIYSINWSLYDVMCRQNHYKNSNLITTNLQTKSSQIIHTYMQYYNTVLTNTLKWYSLPRKKSCFIFIFVVTIWWLPFTYKNNIHFWPHSEKKNWKKDCKYYSATVAYASLSTNARHKKIWSACMQSHLYMPVEVLKVMK